MPEFQPHEVTIGRGILAITPMPGRTRHYGTDWQRLVDWRPDMVITMCLQSELARKGAGSLGADLQATGIDWAYVPVVDMGAPDLTTEHIWTQTAMRAGAHLGAGGRVLVHCYGGCGRSGMAVLRLMIDAGEPPEAALTRLRFARPCAVETNAQLEWATRGALTQLPEV